MKQTGTSFLTDGWKGPLATKQLVYILIFSSIITLTFASIQIFLEYRTDIGDVNSQLNQIRNGYTDSLSSSLWKLDDTQVKVELNDALSHRDIEYLEIREGAAVLFSAGKLPDTDALISKTYDLKYIHKGETQHLGFLKAVASLEGTYQRMVKRIAYIVITQGIKTFLVSFFILFIIYRLVIRHLNDLAKYSRNMDLTGITGDVFSFKRSRKPKKYDDELEDLANGINTMRQRVIQDISDLRQREKEKENLEQQLRQSQKMESLGTLAGGIAHDFNNILAPILGNTELLMEDLPPESRHLRFYLNEILTSSLRARDLVKQILTFSRQEPLEFSPIMIQPILKEALKLLRSTTPSSITIQTDIRKDCPGTRADATHVHQIILNLATNAAHAMEERGGTLEVSLIPVRLDVFRIKKDRLDDRLVPGNYIRLRVSDTGVGMEEKTIEKIFEPFFTTKQQQKGTGLGLSMVHGIVKSYAGCIQVYSTPGKGSQFDIYLPAEERGEDNGKSDEKQPTGSLPQGREHILVVDDESAVLSVQAQMLTRLGYRVTSAESGAQALKFFQKAPRKFDLVMTDMTMPEMTGDILAKAVGKLRRNIPVVICTGFSEKVISVQHSDSGIRGILLKPLVMSDLAVTLRKILDG